MNLLGWMTWKTLSSFEFTAWGLKESSNLDYKISVDISLGYKHQAWYISKPWLPDHLRSILFFLVSGKLAHSTFKAFPHFSI